MELKNKVTTLGKFLSAFGLSCDALHDLVPFIQFKKREKHPWRSITFSKVAGTLPHGCFSRF